MSQPKLLMIMIDGLSADYFQTHRSRLPHLSSLAEEGFAVDRMRAPVPGTSMPGRASILTGVTADRHGIFGNSIATEDAFRPPQAEDVLVPTIAQLAFEAGLDVACIGHALVRPQDASIYVPPCWLASDFPDVPAGGEVPEVLRVKDPSGRLTGMPLTSKAFPETGPDALSGITGFLVGDQLLMAAASRLACSDAAPDFILVEINAPDAFQHHFGYESAQAHFSTAFADMLVGQCLDRLRSVGCTDYTVAIVSDHGHGPIDSSIYPGNIIPDDIWATEGATLQLLAPTEAEREAAAAKLARYGVEPWSGDHIPASRRDGIATFVAPPGHDFEETPAVVPASQATGRSQYKSTHGFRPGTPADDRMCLFAGPGVPRGTADIVAAERFAPTLAALLGLSLEAFPDRPLFPVI